MSLLAPARAADAAEDAARVSQVEVDEMAALYGPDVRDYVDAYYTKRVFYDPRILPTVPKQMRVFVVNACHDLAAVRRWRQHRIVYTIDTQLADELTQTDPEDTIPGRLVHQLPHPNPFVVFPEHVDIPIPDQPGCSTRYTGAFLHGTDELRRPTSTDDPDARRISLVFPGWVIGPDGKRRHGRMGNYDVAWARISLNDEPVRMGDLIVAAFQRFQRGTPMTEGLSDAGLIVSSLVGRIVPIITYLCAANAERRLAPAVATKNRADGSARADKKTPRVVEHGYWLGPALAAARREAATKAASQPTGRKMRAHVRRAHWHTYWTGEGRTVPILHWLPPIPVNKDGEAAKPTVVPVTS